MKFLLSMAAALAVLSGCAVYTPDGAVVAPLPGVYYQPPVYYYGGPIYRPRYFHRHHHHGRDFCRGGRRGHC